MILFWLFYFINFLIGITTKLLFKIDYTKELRKQYIKDFFDYMIDAKI